MKPIKRTLLAGGLVVVLVSSEAGAQQVTPGEGSEDAKLRFGWLALDPRLSVRDVGVDTNVYNSSLGSTADLTATVGPEVESWVRAGRLYMNGVTTVGWNYFQKSSEQRFLDFGQVGRADLALVGFTPHVGGTYERTRRRPNEEIDARVRQVRTRAHGGLAVHPGPRLTFDATYELRTFDFGGENLGDIVLAHELNRTEGEATISGFWALTPLTTFVVKGAHRTDEFESPTGRDSRSVNLMSGLEFKPAALISGSALVGFRAFSPKQDDLPGFNGVTAAVNLHYIARDRLQLNTSLNRDVDYSYEPQLPYYISTSVRADAVQAIGGSWDVAGRVGITHMAYQGFERAGLVPFDRRDRSWYVGTGLGRRLGTDVRVGVDVNYVTRESNAAFRDYSGVRAGGTVTYGY